MSSSKKVTVIGGGLGGAAAAILLAEKGFQVDLFEKNSHIGGKLNIHSEGGFHFDLGPSIFTLPQMFRPVFEGAGKKLEDYVSLSRLDPQWRNFFEDGSVIDLYEDRDRMAAELSKVSPVANQEYSRFLEYSKTQYDVVESGYFRKGLDGFWPFIKHYGLFGASRLDFNSTMAEGIAKRFSDGRLRDIFEYFIKYVGSSAYDAPGFMNLMPNIQLEYGLWYIQGGLYELGRAFQKRLAETGVKVHLNCEVTQVLHSGKKVSGTEAKDASGAIRKTDADYVVSNMEVIPAYGRLLNENEKFMSSLERYEPACSGIVLHLGVREKYPQLAHHNFFYSQNQEKHFDRVFREKKLPDDPTVYLVAPSRTDSTQAPEGCENIKILPHIPYINDAHPYTREDCVKLKDRVIDKLERMGLKNLRKNIIVEDFWTPFDIEKKYYSNRGAIYGVVSDRKKNFAFKAPKQSSKYDNLYFVGGSVNPGGGMPMVVLSGCHVARMITEKSDISP